MHDQNAALWVLFSTCFLAGMGFLLCLVLFVTPSVQKERAGEEYARMEKALREAPKEQAGKREQAAETPAAAAGTKEEKEKHSADSASQGLSESAFAALNEENPSFVGVLTFPILHFSYPVAQGEDNTEYLQKTFSGTPSPSGSVFLDASADPGLTDRNSFVFAHCMADGSMFGSLKALGETSAIAESTPNGIYFRIEKEKQEDIYRVLFFGPVKTDDTAFYCRVFSDADYDAWLLHAEAASWYDPGEGARKKAEKTRPNLVILSTCYGTDHRENFAVVGARWERAAYNAPDIKGATER